MIEAPTLEVRGLSKSFGANQALQDVDLLLAPGEFIGLMGPNGAGKSTFIKILGGVYTRSTGEILVGGKPVASLAGHPAVGFIHQDLGLVDGLSVSDNLRLGERPMRLAGPVLDLGRERAAARRALDLIGLNVSASTLVGELSSGEKALVAIARAFARGASILFVDESTSTLPPGEARRVIDALKELSENGATIVMVTHKLSEILDATNRVVVLLDGRIGADRPTAGLDRAGLVELLVQHDTAADALTGSHAEPGEVLLELVEACSPHIGPIDLRLRAGQVVGISGLPGSGLHDIGLMAQGALTPRSGRVVPARRDLRRALVPPHRESQGGFADLSVGANLTISSLRTWRTPWRLIATHRERADSLAMAEELDLRPRGITTPYGVLSGGNKQKVVFGRALLKNPEVYVLCEPTRGVDIGTRAEIYRLIHTLRDRGAAVLVVSSDAEDLFSACDLIGIVEHGRVGALKAVGEMTASELELMV